MGLCRIKETKPDDHHHKNKTVSIHISPGFALTHSPDWRASLRVRVCPFQDSEVKASLSCSARKLQWRETVDERDCWAEAYKPQGKGRKKLLDSDEVRWWWHVGVGTFPWVWQGPLVFSLATGAQRAHLFQPWRRYRGFYVFIFFFNCYNFLLSVAY